MKYGIIVWWYNKGCKEDMVHAISLFKTRHKFFAFSNNDAWWRAQMKIVRIEKKLNREIIGFSELFRIKKDEWVRIDEKRR